MEEKKVDAYSNYVQAKSDIIVENEEKLFSKVRDLCIEENKLGSNQKVVNNEASLESKKVKMDYFDVYHISDDCYAWLNIADEKSMKLTSDIKVSSNGESKEKKIIGYTNSGTAAISLEGNKVIYSYNGREFKNLESASASYVFKLLVAGGNKPKEFLLGDIEKQEGKEEYITKIEPVKVEEVYSNTAIEVIKENLAGNKNKGKIQEILATFDKLTQIDRGPIRREEAESEIVEIHLAAMIEKEAQIEQEIQQKAKQFDLNQEEIGTIEQEVNQARKKRGQLGREHARVIKNNSELQDEIVLLEKDLELAQRQNKNYENFIENVKETASEGITGGIREFLVKRKIDRLQEKYASILSQEPQEEKVEIEIETEKEEKEPALEAKQQETIEEKLLEILQKEKAEINEMPKNEGRLLAYIELMQKEKRMIPKIEGQMEKQDKQKEEKQRSLENLKGEAEESKLLLQNAYLEKAYKTELIGELDRKISEQENKQEYYQRIIGELPEKLINAAKKRMPLLPASTVKEHRRIAFNSGRVPVLQGISAISKPGIRRENDSSNKDREF